ASGTASPSRNAASTSPSGMRPLGRSLTTSGISPSLPVPTQAPTAITSTATTTIAQTMVESLALGALGGGGRRTGDAHRLHRLLDVVGEGDQPQVLLRDEAAVGDGVRDPVHQAAPVVRAEQHHREVRDLAGLDQGEGLEQLIERAEPAGQGDEALRVLEEHGLAGEEVPEVDAERYVLVQALLERELDPEPDRVAAGVR